MPYTKADLPTKHSPLGVEGRRAEMNVYLEATEAYKKSL